MIRTPGDSEKISRSKKDQPTLKQLEAEANDLNGFVRYLPGGMYRQFADIVGDRKYKDYYPPEEQENRSQFLLNMTPKEVFALVDKLLKKYNIKEKDVNLVGADSQKQDKARKLIIPVFIELRRMGCTNYELTV